MYKLIKLLITALLFMFMYSTIFATLQLVPIYKQSVETQPCFYQNTARMLGLNHCPPVLLSEKSLEIASTGGVIIHFLAKLTFLYWYLAALILVFISVGLIPTLRFNRWKYSFMVLFAIYFLIAIGLLGWGMAVII